jgi:hypothetical protein
MSRVITPTIGRRVWYYPSDYDRGLLENAPETIIAGDRAQPCDAGICYVHSDRLVNLTVADHNGKMHARTSVKLIQPGDEIESHGAYAIWMPYQVQQAASSAS